MSLFRAENLTGRLSGDELNQVVHQALADTEDRDASDRFAPTGAILLSSGRTGIT
jgi:predicted metal-dependent enzyme (double-stranded beta helix superfamily)